MPMVSVIMPAYNAAKTVGESVRSVLAQTFRDWELIVVDDGSKDETPEILNRFASEDSRIRVFRNEPNAGVSYSRNRAISQARGEWIAFLDSDDLWSENKLELQLNLPKRQPEAVLLYTASGFVTNDGKRLSYVLPAQEKINFRGLLRKNLLSCSSVMVRTDVIREVPFPGDRLHEDFYVWLTILKKVPYAYGVNQPLLIYRLTENSRSGNALRSTGMLYRTYRAIGISVPGALLRIPGYLLYVLNKKRKQKQG